MAAPPAGPYGLAVSPRRTFLVEAYAPSSSDVGGLSEQAQLAALTADGVGPIHHLRSILVPEDEICLHLFEAESAESVARAIGDANLRAQRIVEVRS